MPARRGRKIDGSDRVAAVEFARGDDDLEILVSRSGKQEGKRGEENGKVSARRRGFHRPGLRLEPTRVKFRLQFARTVGNKYILRRLGALFNFSPRFCQIGSIAVEEIRMESIRSRWTGMRKVAWGYFLGW